ncbi:MAG: hypothetical protein QOE88_1163 [Verrucomicrobiota bacterium]|nr:hypothetical protein [Verrucomicrobiota bacterium]
MPSSRNTVYTPELFEMDFQRLFKRKEEVPALPLAGDNTRETFNEREVLVCEGELLDGKLPAPLLWSNVGGAIKIKADKILGILEGRTRIKASVLQDIYPALFEKVPNHGTEFNIPLQAVVTQLEDIFRDQSSEVSILEDFDTPFGQLAREDEERFEVKAEVRSDKGTITATNDLELQEVASEKILAVPERNGGQPEPTRNALAPDLKGDEASSHRINASDESRAKDEEITSRECRGMAGAFLSENGRVGESPDQAPIRKQRELHLNCAERAQSTGEGLVPGFDNVVKGSGGSPISLAPRKLGSEHIRRRGHDSLQELYLTDELLNGSKVADLILQLPRVVSVVILLSDGAALGGSLGGGLNEALLSEALALVQHLLRFTKNMEGGPAKFVILSNEACRLSLTFERDILILVGHAGKNIPPGLRERLVATAHALNMIYGTQP